jgi:hypothetical protein
MGVRGVWAYFRRLFTPVRLEGKKTIGIDMLCLIYTYRTVLDELVAFIKELQAAGYTILCIWDGVAPKEKQGILNERKSQRDKSLEKKEALSAYIEEYGAQLDERDLKSLSTAITSLEWQGWHLSYKKKKEIQAALGSMEHIVAEGEADDLLLEMAFSGKIDSILTLDSDLFVMGAPCVWRLLGTKPWKLEQIEVERICRMSDISLGDLQDAAYLAGWDRCHLSGHVYMTFHKAMEQLKTADLESLPLILDAESHARLLQIKTSTHALWKEIFKQRKLTME